jgi:hypothetical protein
VTTTAPSISSNSVIGKSTPVLPHQAPQQSSVVDYHRITDEGNFDAALVPSALSSQTARNEKVKQVIEYDKASSVPHVTASTIGEEKRKLPKTRRIKAPKGKRRPCSPLLMGP